MIEYKGYTMGPIEIDVTDDTLSATVAGLKDVIYFEGSSATELQQAFRKSIDDYLALCADRGRPPDRPYTGGGGRCEPERMDFAAHRRGGLKIQLHAFCVCLSRVAKFS